MFKAKRVQRHSPFSAQRLSERQDARPAETDLGSGPARPPACLNTSGLETLCRPVWGAHTVHTVCCLPCPGPGPTPDP